MHVAIVSEYDTRDVRAWSGIPFFIARALRRQVDRVSLVGPLRRPAATPRLRLRQIKSRARGERFLRQHTVPVARAMGEQASAQLRLDPPDVVLAIGTTPVGWVETPAPIVTWVDATFESNLYFYDAYAGLEAANVAEGHAVEQRALDRAALSVYPSAFALRSARGYYGKAEVALVPFGANLPDPPSGEDVERAIRARAVDRVRLLFLGAGWVRKGGDVAARAVGELRQRGVDAELVVAGSPVPAQDRGPGVRAVGFLDKGTNQGAAAFDRLLATSHALLLPTRAEAFGCVFCEASAYGVPSIAPAIGGVPTAVEDGVNGRLVPPRATPAEIADAVEGLAADPDGYRELCRSARARFERELNWDAAVGRVVARLRELAP